MVENLQKLDKDQIESLVLDSNFCTCGLYCRPFMPVKHRNRFDKLVNYDPLGMLSGEVSTNNSQEYSTSNNSSVTSNIR